MIPTIPWKTSGYLHLVSTPRHNLSSPFSLGWHKQLDGQALDMHYTTSSTTLQQALHHNRHWICTTCRVCVILLLSSYLHSVCSPSFDTRAFQVYVAWDRLQDCCES